MYYSVGKVKQMKQMLLTNEIIRLQHGENEFSLTKSFFKEAVGELLLLETAPGITHYVNKQL